MAASQPVRVRAGCTNQRKFFFTTAKKDVTCKAFTATLLQEYAKLVKAAGHAEQPETVLRLVDGFGCAIPEEIRMQDVLDPDAINHVGVVFRSDMDRLAAQEGLPREELLEQLVFSRDKMSFSLSTGLFRRPDKKRVSASPELSDAPTEHKKKKGGPVKLKLEELVTKGVCAHTDITDGLRARLLSLATETGLKVLKKFEELASGKSGDRAHLLTQSLDAVAPQSPKGSTAASSKALTAPTADANDTAASKKRKNKEQETAKEAGAKKSKTADKAEDDTAKKLEEAKKKAAEKEEKERLKKEAAAQEKAEKERLKKEKAEREKKEKEEKAAAKKLEEAKRKAAEKEEKERLKKEKQQREKEEKELKRKQQEEEKRKREAEKAKAKADKQAETERKKAQLEAELAKLNASQAEEEGESADEDSGGDKAGAEAAKQDDASDTEEESEEDQADKAGRTTRADTKGEQDKALMVEKKKLDEKLAATKSPAAGKQGAAEGKVLAFADDSWHATVKAVIDELENKNKFKPAELDPGALKAIRTLPAEAAVALLNKVRDEKTAIRNMNAYVVKNASILRNQWGIDEAASSSSSSSSSSEGSDSDSDDE